MGRAGRDQAGSEQALDLGGEQQPVAIRGVLDGPVQRADAEAVPAQDQALLPGVEEGDGELAAQPGERLLAVVFPQVRYDLGVAVSAEAMAERLELAALLGVVEQLAVKDDGDGAVLVGDGLAAIGEADDAEAARGEGEARQLQKAVLVGAAVVKGLGHGPDAAGRHWTPARKIDNARDAAHDLGLSGHSPVGVELPHLAGDDKVRQARQDAIDADDPLGVPAQDDFGAIALQHADDGLRDVLGGQARG